MKKWILICAIILGVLAGGFYALNTYIYNEKQGEVLPAQTEPRQATLSGTLVCLPHKGNGPSTKECTLGLRTDAGVNYGLSLALLSSTPPILSAGDYITASGVISLVPENDRLSIYDVEGLFSPTAEITVHKENAKP